MDPHAIADECAAAVDAVSRLSTALAAFVRDVRDARRDVESISQHLLPLGTVLDLLCDDFEAPPKTPLPASLLHNILTIIKTCTHTTMQIEAALASHASSALGKTAHWTSGGREDVLQHRGALETYKSALELALEMVALRLAQDMQCDSTGAAPTQKHTQTQTQKAKQKQKQKQKQVLPPTRDATAVLFQEITLLRTHVSSPCASTSDDGLPFALERFLAESTSYATSVAAAARREGEAAQRDVPLLPPGMRTLRRRVSFPKMRELQRAKYPWEPRVSRTFGTEYVAEFVDYGGGGSGRVALAQW